MSANWRRDALSSRRGISSTPRLQDDAKPEESKPEDGEDGECPSWQNPIHHAAPLGTKVFPEDFEPGEEMPVIPLPPFQDPENPDAVLAAPHLHELAEEITKLSMVEMVELVNRVGDHFDLRRGHRRRRGAVSRVVRPALRQEDWYQG